MITQVRAHQIVCAAVKNGDLTPAKEEMCVDCGAAASGYDHRDYQKPLDVEPVCAKCNNKRGAAKGEWDTGVKAIRKNLYLDQSDIDWVEKERQREARGFSNYITKLIRDDRARKFERNVKVPK